MISAGQGSTQPLAETPKHIEELSRYNSGQVAARLENGESNRGSITNYGIDDGNFSGANLGSVTNNYTSNIQTTVINQGDKRESDSTAGLRNEAKRLKANEAEDGSNSNILFLDHSMKVFKKKQLHSQKLIYEGEISKKAPFTPIPIAVKLVSLTDRALKEARSLEVLHHHPYVVGFHHCNIYMEGELEFEYVFIAMELCSKETLYDYVSSQKERGFDPYLAIRHAKQLLSGLEYIHSKDIIHRDLKPHNILFSRRGSPYQQVKIADFGLSKSLPAGKSSTTQTNPGAGTRGYMAAEVIARKEITKKSDIFSLGVLLYFRLSNGLHPYGQNYVRWELDIQQGEEPKLDGLLIEDEKMKQTAKDLIRRMLQLDPDKRPSASDALEEWRKIDPKGTEGMTQTIEERGNEELEAEPEGQSDKVVHEDKGGISKPSIILFKGMQLSRLLISEGKWELEDITELTSTISGQTHTAVVIGRNVYVLTWMQYVYELNLDNLAAGWKRVESTNELHGIYPPATTLNEQIYVCGGGWEFSGTFRKRGIPFHMASDVCEVYTPSKEWKVIAKMNEERGHNCVVSHEGKVYSIGGWDAYKTPLKSVERYDPGTDEWKALEPMNEARHSAAATVFGGKIYVLGGEGKRGTLNTIECFDPVTDRWTVLPFEMHSGRKFFSAVAFRGRIFAVGGTDDGSLVEKLNLDKKRCSAVQNLSGTPLPMSTFVLK